MCTTYSIVQQPRIEQDPIVGLFKDDYFQDDLKTMTNKFGTIRTGRIEVIRVRNFGYEKIVIMVGRSRINYKQRISHRKYYFFQILISYSNNFDSTG